MPIQPSPYARRQNRLRQQHPDVVEFRIKEASRYENYERHVLARNYNASAHPKYLEHFNHAPHKIHMVSSCIEQVTRAVETIQQQQLARAEAGNTMNPLAAAGKAGNTTETPSNYATNFTLEQNMSGIGADINLASGGGVKPSSSSSRFRGPSTTAKLFLPDGAESMGETMNPDYRHYMEDQANDDATADGNEVDDGTVRQKQQQRGAHRLKSAEEIVTGAGGIPRKTSPLNSSLSSSGRRKSSPLNNNNNKGARSPSPNSPTAGLNNNNNSSSLMSTSKRSASPGGESTGGFFSNFDDPTRKFRFKPVELAEALADPPVHPLPRPPLFSRPCKGQTVIVGGDIRLVGRSINSSSDALSEPKAIAHANVARDPQMLAVRVAVEQNPLHEAIEQMRQVTAAMAVKTYNAVNAMNTIVRQNERDEMELNHKEQNQILPSLQRQGGLGNSSASSVSSPNSARRSYTARSPDPRVNLINSARGKRLRDPTALSQSVRRQQQTQQQTAQTARPPSRPIQMMNGGFGKKPSTPQRQRQIEESLIHSGRHLEDESIVASKPPTRESQVYPANSVSMGSIRGHSSDGQNGRNNSPGNVYKTDPNYSPPKNNSQEEKQHETTEKKNTMIPSPPSRKAVAQKPSSASSSRKSNNDSRVNSAGSSKKANAEEKKTETEKPVLEEVVTATPADETKTEEDKKEEVTTAPQEEESKTEEPEPEDEKKQEEVEEEKGDNENEEQATEDTTEEPAAETVEEEKQEE